MAYRAEIEIALKGASQLREFQNKLERTANTVDNLNTFLSVFADKADGIPRTVANLSRQLSDAAQNFNNVALGTNEARIAAVDYLNATKELNKGLRERAALLAEVAENERKARFSPDVREVTMYSGPIGPGQASSILGGQSMPAGGRIERIRNARQDERDLKKALLRLEEKSAAVLNEKVQAQQNLVAGTQEVFNLLQRQAALASKGIRETTQYAGPIGPGQASSILGGQSMPAGGRIQRILNARQDELKLQEALLRLEEKSAAELNEKVQAQQNLVAGTQEVFNLLQRQAGLSQYAQPLPIPGGLKTEQVLAVQAAKRTENLAIEQRLQRTAASTVTQYNLQLGILRQMAEIGKRINESTQQELVNQRRLNRVLRVRQGREFQRRRREAAGSAIIGGAFPLLFGQGIGAAAGGGLGGAAGGAIGGQFGFGLSLVGTAAGQAVDNFINNIKTLGESLKDPAQTLTALEEAGFAVDDSVKQTVEQLLKANKVYEAQTVALQQITDTLGPGSVELLNAYDKESKKLNSSYQDLTASITRSFLPALVGAVAAINDLSAGTKNIQVPKDLLKLLSLLSPSGLILSGPATLLEQRGRQAAEEAGRPDAPDSTAATEAAKKARETADQLDRQAGILRDQVRLAELNGNLTNERVFDLRKSIIYQEAALELAKDGLTTEQRAVIELRRKLKLQNLLNERVDQTNRAREDAARKAESAARKAERAQEQRIKQLNTATVNAYNSENALLDVRLATLEVEKGAVAAAKQKLTNIALERDNAIAILEIQYKEVAAKAKSNEEALTLYTTYLNQRAVLKEQAELEYERTKQKIAQLNVEKELIALQAQRGVQTVGRDIGRQISDVQRDLSFPFGGEEAERLDLLVSQERRREDALRKVNEQIADQIKLRDAALPGDRESFNIKIKGLQDELKLYEQLLPQLDAVEQAQLRQNQLIEKYGFLANELSTAMSSAVQAVVTGTGTVEEAFATMFQNIGKAFIDMATQIIAQQIVMITMQAILKALGGPSFGGGGGAPNVDAISQYSGIGANTRIPTPTFRANGGSVSPNSTYIVGERGPELLTMGSQGGYVHSNTSAAMDRYRNGEGPAGTRTVNVSYSVTEINGMRFVTEDQFRAGMDQAAQRGAKMGQSRTISTLKNSRAQRSKLGL